MQVLFAAILHKEESVERPPHEIWDHQEGLPIIPDCELNRILPQQITAEGLSHAEFEIPVLADLAGHQVGNTNLLVSPND